MGVDILSPADLPIPRDIAPGPGWSDQMLEMATHIGAYETLLLSEHYGGREFYIPVEAEKNPFRLLIGAEKARVLSWALGRTTIVIPTARYALSMARRAPILASVRAGDITVSDAARMMGTRRDYVSKLVHKTVEGVGRRPLPRRQNMKDPRQIDMFGGD